MAKCPFTASAAGGTPGTGSCKALWGSECVTICCCTDQTRAGLKPTRPCPTHWTYRSKQRASLKEPIGDLAGDNLPSVGAIFRASLRFPGLTPLYFHEVPPQVMQRQAVREPAVLQCSVTFKEALLDLGWFGWVVTSRVGRDSLTPILLRWCLGSVFTEFTNRQVVLGKSAPL